MKANANNVAAILADRRMQSLNPVSVYPLTAVRTKKARTDNPTDHLTIFHLFISLSIYHEDGIGKDMETLVPESPVQWIINHIYYGSTTFIFHCKGYCSS